MAPHAESPTRKANESTVSYHDDHLKRDNSNNSQQQQLSMLPASDPDELHDVIFVGFGPASLAIATALHDSIEFRRNEFSSFYRNQPKVAFLERQEQFAWHSGMQIPGATMQISWVKDLATLRNPRSQFTFLNYLFKVGRLVDFTNLGTFLPLRLEYEDYLRWCAKWFSHVTSYNQEAISLRPEEMNGKGRTDSFRVTSRNLRTNKIETRRARHVVIAVGGKPQIPAHLPQSDPRVIHSSTYTWAIPKVLSDRDRPYRIAVVGAGQSAAEIFHDLQSRYPNCQSRLLIRDSALRPSDDSPFVNEIFNPDRTDTVFDAADDQREEDIRRDKATNYGVVRLELLEKIYADLYAQKLKLQPEHEPQHAILPYREVIGAEDSVDQAGLKLKISDRRSIDSGSVGAETMDVDALIVAAGYARDAHEDLLKDARHLMKGGDEIGKK